MRPDHTEDRSTRFRKKSVVIEAMQFDGTEGSTDQVMDWIDTHGLPDDLLCWAVRVEVDPDLWEMQIETLEGTMTASPGDWIIRGVQGEFYPCKPDIFTSTYEPAGEPADEAAKERR